MNRSCLFTISAPSGAGKTSLVKALLEKTSDVAVSVSHATRARRPGEVDGRDYHFVSIEQFEQMVSEDAFLEHARVFDNYYGTSQQAVEDLLEQGKHVILEIDWQGARQVKAKLPDTVAIFILPPSRETLRQRLTDRATDDQSIIERRMADADREMSHYSDAEFLVINDDFDQALQDLECIIHTQALKLERQKLKNPELIASIKPETV
ncbi:MAG: guanylate kinase [Gammaproteobacteria bacterium]|nr:guanylate kinase [Gammaproteobacteria bacterium]